MTLWLAMVVEQQVHRLNQWIVRGLSLFDGQDLELRPRGRREVQRLAAACLLAIRLRRYRRTAPGNDIVQRQSSAGSGRRCVALSLNNCEMPPTPAGDGRRSAPERQFSGGAVAIGISRASGWSPMPGAAGSSSGPPEDMSSSLP